VQFGLPSAGPSPPPAMPDAAGGAASARLAHSRCQPMRACANGTASVTQRSRAKVPSPAGAARVSPVGASRVCLNHCVIRLKLRLAVVGEDVHNWMCSKVSSPRSSPAYVRWVCLALSATGCSERHPGTCSSIPTDGPSDLGNTVDKLISYL
jgi:hypothetical protein